MNREEFFTELKQHTRPVVVDFWASWCGPCRIARPLLKQFAQKYKGQVDFWEINADEHPELLQQLGVRGIPTLFLSRSGREIYRATGVLAAPIYDQLFAKLAAGKNLRGMGMAAPQRILRIGTGAILLGYGLAQANWLLVGLGALIAFSGLYDFFLS